MSFQWNVVDDREQQRKVSETLLKLQLREQHEQNKLRKDMERQREREDARKNLQLPTQHSTLPAQTFTTQTLKPGYSTNIDTKIRDQSNPSEDLTTSSKDHESLLLKLRYTEDQLHSERRSRSWLESELQNGKSALTQITQRMDVLSTNMQALETLTLPSFTQRLDGLHLGIREIKEGYSGIQGTVEECVLGVRGCKDDIREVGCRVDVFDDGMSMMRREVRAVMAGVEGLKELIHGAHEGMMKHGMHVKGIEDRFDKAADQLHTSINGALSDIHSRIEGESQARKKMNATIQDMYTETRAAMLAQHNALSTRLDKSREEIRGAVGQESHSRQKAIAAVIAQMHDWQRAVKETEAGIANSFGDLDKMLETRLAEQYARGNIYERHLREEIDEVFRGTMKGMQNAQREVDGRDEELKRYVQESVEKMNAMYGELVNRVRLEVECVEKQVKQVEERGSSVVRKIEDGITPFPGMVQSVEGRLESMINAVEREGRVEANRLMEEWTRQKEDWQMTLSRVKEEMESKLEKIWEQVNAGQQDQMVSRGNTDRVHVNAVVNNAVMEAQTLFQAQIMKLHGRVDSLDDAVNAAKKRTDDLAAFVNDQLNIKSQQIDATLTAFKADLKSRMTQQDAEKLEESLRKCVTDVKTTMDTVVQSTKNMDSRMMQSAMKSDVQQILDNVTRNVQETQEKMAAWEEHMAEVARKSHEARNKDDLQAVEDRTKSLMMELHVRNKELSDRMDGLQTALTDKLNSKKMNDALHSLSGQLKQIKEEYDVINKAFRTLKTEMKGEYHSKIEFAREEQKVGRHLILLESKMRDAISGSRERMDRLLKTWDKRISDTLTTMEQRIMQTTATQNDKFYQLKTELKEKIREKQRANAIQLKEDLASQNAVLQDQLILLSGLQEKGVHDAKALQQNWDDATQKFYGLQAKLDEFKESISTKVEAFVSLQAEGISEVREALKLAVSSEDFTQHILDFNRKWTTLHNSVEVSNQTQSSLARALKDMDSSTTDRIHASESLLTKQMDVNTQQMKSWWEGCIQRLTKLDSKVASDRTRLEHIQRECGRLDKVLEEGLGVSVQALERQHVMLRNQVEGKVGIRHLDDAVAGAMGTVQVQLDKLMKMGEKEVPATFFKPTHKTKSQLSFDKKIPQFGGESKMGVNASFPIQAQVDNAPLEF